MQSVPQPVSSLGLFGRFSGFSFIRTMKIPGGIVLAQRRDGALRDSIASIHDPAEESSNIINP